MKGSAPSDESSPSSGAKVKALRGWMRDNPLPASAVLGGVAFVTGSFVVNGQLAALMVNVGVSLGLVVVLFVIEQRLLAGSEARQEQQLTELKDELVTRFEGPPREAAARVVRRAHDEVQEAADAFFDNPTPGTLTALVDIADALKLSRATQFEIMPGWALNVSVVQHPYKPNTEPRPLVSIKVLDRSSKKQTVGTAWRDDMTYEDMLDALRLNWINLSKSWPGDDAFEHIDFPRLIAGSYVQAIEDVGRGAGITV